MPTKEGTRSQVQGWAVGIRGESGPGPRPRATSLGKAAAEPPDAWTWSSHNGLDTARI